MVMIEMNWYRNVIRINIVNVLYKKALVCMNDLAIKSKAV